MADEDKPIGRRRFFRAGLAELLKPLGKAVRPLEHMANELGRLEQPAPAPAAPAPPAPKPEPRVQPPLHAASLRPAPMDRPWLRPPGALPEVQFRAACSRCGECVKVCPAQCIKLDPSGVDGAGVPFVEVETAACVLCDGLLCMHHCPTGALAPTPLADIDMGTAFWNERICVRSAGQECTRCVDFCPVGPAAIEPAGPDMSSAVRVHAEGCTGCGLCQHHCPTDPKSIVVIPKSVRRPSAPPV